MARSASTRRASAGFTLVEALISVTVIFLLVNIAAPALAGLVVVQQMKNAGYDLASTLVYARSEALTRNVSVTITPTDADWAHGWIVSEEGGTVLRRQSAYGRVTLNGPANVIFNGDGRPNSTATPFAITSPDADVESGRCVRLRLNGRPSIAKGAC